MTFLWVSSPLFLVQTLKIFPHLFSLHTMLLTMFFFSLNKAWTREDIKWRQWWWCYQLGSSSAFLSPMAYLECRWVTVERCKKKMLSWDVSLMLNTWPGAGLVCRLLAWNSPHSISFVDSWILYTKQKWNNTSAVMNMSVTSMWILMELTCHD